MFEFLKEMEVQKTAGDVVALRLNEVRSFNQQIFKPYEGKRLEEMIESVRSYGVINPIIVRDRDKGYEILSGHERVRASKSIGFISIPAYNLGEISDDEARFVVAESNILQRGFMELKISERAKCIDIRYKAMKAQGLRSDLLEDMRMLIPQQQNELLYPLDRQEVDDKFDLTPRSQRRYIRINMLVDSLKNQIDNKRIPLNAGVNFSYLRRESQLMVSQLLGEQSYRVSVSQSVKIRIADEAEPLDEKDLFRILDKEEVVIKKKLKVRKTLIDKYFVGYDKDEIEDVIASAIDNWFIRGGELSS